MTYQEYIKYVALDRKVLAVAVAHDFGKWGDWACYTGAVKGKNHDLEYMEVARNGNKMSKSIAEKLFPDFAIKYIWRD